MGPIMKNFYLFFDIICKLLKLSDLRLQMSEPYKYECIVIFILRIEVETINAPVEQQSTIGCKNW